MTSNILNFLKGVFRTSTKGYNVEERDGLVYRTGSPNPFSGNVHYEQDYGKRKGSSFIGYKDGLRHGMTEKYFFYVRYTFEHQYPSDRPLRKQIQEICDWSNFTKLLHPSGSSMWLDVKFSDGFELDRNNFWEHATIELIKKDTIFELIERTDR